MSRTCLHKLLCFGGRGNGKIFGVEIKEKCFLKITHFLCLRGSCHKRQKPQVPIRNRQTRKAANAKGLNRNTNLA